jgi:hypothetical protein
LASSIASIGGIFNPLYFSFHPIYSLSTVSMYWQLLTFPYVCIHPLQAIFLLSEYIPNSSRKEVARGTFRFFIYFTLQNIMMAFLYTTFFDYKVLFDTSPSYYLFPFLYGFWSSMMHEIVFYSIEDSETFVRFMFTPFSIKRKYYPFVFLVAWAIYGDYYEIAIGFATGYLGKV